jgi:ubiquinone/menaquinone biosynthesis C-methylase UbiE
MSTITVIIPAYRAAATIGRAVDSVLSQTRKPDQILIIDDGSPDDISASLARYGSQVALIKQPNAGAASARNRGIAAATGDLIAFLDADDFWDDQKLQRQAGIFQANSQVGLVSGTYFTKHPAGIRETTFIPKQWLNTVVRPTGADIIELASHIWTGTVMVRRESLGKNRFITQFEPAEDRDLWIQVLRNNSAYLLSDPLATAVLEPHSLSRRDPDYGYEPMIRVLHRHADLTTPQQLARLETVVYRGWAAAHLIRGDGRRAIHPASERVKRQPTNLEAWWVLAKAWRLSLSAPKHSRSGQTETRDLNSLRDHFEIEKELAERLRNAPADQRRTMYRDVYNELFHRVADHPQNRRKADPAGQRAATLWQWRLLSHFISPKSAYLEVGAGDGHLAMQVAKKAKAAYAVDVSEVIASGNDTPVNFSWVLTDGVRIPIATASVNVAYSNQLMEHLHPQDANAQLSEIRRTLAPGGAYICITPHRFSGPHDISKFFTDTPCGFHLKEYTYAELDKVFRQAGFEYTRVWTGLKGKFFRISEGFVIGMESLIGLLPRAWQKKITRSALLRPIFINVTLVGYTPRDPNPPAHETAELCTTAS